MFFVGRHYNVKWKFSLQVKSQHFFHTIPLLGYAVLRLNPISLPHSPPDSGSPAEAAGVRAGDVVTKINGKPVTAANWYDVPSSAESRVRSV